MYLLLQLAPLVIEWWHLGLTGIGVVAPIVIAIMNMNRANKRDTQKKLDAKADVVVVNTLETKVDKMNKYCDDQRKELKRDFIGMIRDLKSDINRSNDELSKKFDLLLDKLLK